MAKIEQYSRIINHGITTAGTQFTIPTSNDHTDETWVSTDLYIGEIGVNLTDDKVYVRTNNGIVELSTGTSSGGSSSSPFVFNSPNIVIASTYSADAVTRRSGYFTDLGSSTLRWKDLYLGGSSLGLSTIDVNGGLVIKETSNGILTTNGILASNAPFEINGTSSITTKDRGLHINSRSTRFVGAGNIDGAFIGCVSASMSNCSSTVFIGAQNVNTADSLNSVIHLGVGLNKTNYDTEMVYAGGGLAIRGLADDGSTQYAQSDWITKQSSLRTTDSLTYDLASIPWVGTASGGNVVQVKGYVTAVMISDASLVYSAEIMGCYSIDAAGNTYEIAVPILHELSSFPNTPPVIEMGMDNSGLSIKCTGDGSYDAIQWLCSYSYHRMMNIV